MGIDAKDFLNELKWRHGALDRALIHYRHRGAPGDERVVKGAHVRALGRSFLLLDERGPGSAAIPYHRVLRIEVDGVLLWQRPGQDAR